jgi:hypothetical protein
MKTVTCSNCNKHLIPLNNSVKIDGNTYCEPCLEIKFPEKKDLENRHIEREMDPTICSFCSKDFGVWELKKISVHPICDDCEVKLKHRTFPVWVKAFLAGVLAIVIFSFYWNWKYYQAFKEVRQSNQYASKGDFANAALFMTAAGKKVSEVDDLPIAAAYYTGIDCLIKDSSKAAMVEFNKCKDRVPPGFNLNAYIIQAKIGIAFDDKDYPGFVTASKEYLALDTTQASSWTSVASAYACEYAEKGTDSARLESARYMDRAKSIDSTSKDQTEYYNMIDYRIASRKIIRRNDFIKQFPNGWNKN